MTSPKTHTNQKGRPMTKREKVAIYVLLSLSICSLIAATIMATKVMVEKRCTAASVSEGVRK